jgi:putative glutamine amidotransferase
MAKLFSWIRQRDQEHFGKFFALRPDLIVLDARLTPVELAEMDGLLLTGGPDISAQFLRQEIPDPSVIDADADAVRDAWEFAALAHALEQGKPVLAICKGVQLLNVALGGTLHLDIPNHDSPESRSRNIQPLRHDASARHRFELVNSSHHQAIDQLGENLEIEAWSRVDDVIEQVRITNYPFAAGVQYHPERHLIYAPLFADFFSQL